MIAVKDPSPIKLGIKLQTSNFIKNEKKCKVPSKLGPLTGLFSENMLIIGLKIAISYRIMRII